MSIMKWLAPLFVLISFQSFSQESFKQGYIVQMSGDTINGYVRYSNKIAIEFGTSLNTEKNIYSVVDVKGFGFQNGDHYHAIALETQTVFARLLLYGEVSLYNVDNSYFAIAKGSSAQSLEVKTTRVVINGNEVVVEDRLSLAKLQGLLSDCSQSLELDKVVLLNKSTNQQKKILHDVVVKYNTCKGRETKDLYPAKKRRSNHTYFPAATRTNPFFVSRYS